MKIAEKNSFKGKSINYNTKVTATKTEKVIVWICAILCFSAIFYSFLFIKNILLIIGICFLSILLLIAILLIMIFRPSHKEEREENAVVNKK